MNEELPLPEPAFSGWDYDSLPAVQRDGYTADQMREYAKEALAESENDALIIQYHEATIKRLEKLLAQPEQDSRRLQIAMRQWEDWKTYALELQKKLVKYEGGSPMILNTQPDERNFCPRCGKRLASGFVEISIHTCTPPREKNT